MSAPAKAAVRLVGDVGGTNCRFAVIVDGQPVDPQSFLGADFPTLESAIDHYLQRHGGPRPAEAVIAVAGHVEDGKAELTNARWKMSEAALVKAGFKAARLINDYEALSLSVPRLTAKDLGNIGDVTGDPKGTVAIIGAGTGLGVGALVRDGMGDAVAVTEGGHIAFAPTDEIEIEILRRMQALFGRVSLERILSGPGLVCLYQCLADIRGETARDLEPEDVVKEAAAGKDALCAEALARFCKIYGAAAGDFALAFGASGGVYLGGGIAPKIIDTLRASDFRKAFEDKGRFADYLAAIPTRVILHPHAALLGCAEARMATR